MQRRPAVWSVRELKELEVKIVTMGLDMLRWLFPRIGPYVLMEIVLPGGTLFALLLYLYRRWSNRLSA
jgi:hypothetical protein